MNKAQVAYAAYAAARNHKAQDGATLPNEVPPELAQAWEAFAQAVLDGSGVDFAYNQAYLDAVKGKAVSGSPAPSWAFFIHNKPEIAAAWADAANAVLRILLQA